MMYISETSFGIKADLLMEFCLIVIVTHDVIHNFAISKVILCTRWNLCDCGFSVLMLLVGFQEKLLL